MNIEPLCMTVGLAALFVAIVLKVGKMKRQATAERRKNAAIQNAMTAKANSRKPSFYEEDEDRGTVWPKRHY